MIGSTGGGRPSRRGRRRLLETQPVGFCTRLLSWSPSVAESRRLSGEELSSVQSLRGSSGRRPVRRAAGQACSPWYRPATGQWGMRKAQCSGGRRRSSPCTPQALPGLPPELRRVKLASEAGSDRSRSAVAPSPPLAPCVWCANCNNTDHFIPAAPPNFLWVRHQRWNPVAAATGSATLESGPVVGKRHVCVITGWFPREVTSC